jgi:hypothetical protein
MNVWLKTILFNKSLIYVYTYIIWWSAVENLDILLALLVYEL